jgi:hypothetical protein
MFAICRPEDRAILFDRVVAADLPALLTQAAFEVVAGQVNTATILSARAIAWCDSPLFILGDESTETAVAAWFRSKGFSHFSDTFVAIESGEKLTGAPGPLLKIEIDGALRYRPDLADGAGVPKARLSDGLIIFPHLMDGSQLRIEPVSPGVVAMRLMENVVNGRNLPGGGLTDIASLARRFTGVEIHYCEISQLDGIADALAQFLLDCRLQPDDVQRLFSIFGKIAPLAGKPTIAAQISVAEPEKKFMVPAPTPRRDKLAKLTIGMATYDDFDGVYFSVQALRLYHAEIIDEVEYVVIDNHPDGPCAAALKGLDAWIPNYRYVPEPLRTGTSQSRNMVFEEAGGEFVLCMDCHVFVVPGALRRLLDYFNEHPDSADLLQGPLIRDDLAGLATHFKPAWGAGMFGQWDFDERGARPDASPFEIQMQGLGLFACRRDAWLGFHPDFRGFGGEEGYIHEKYRQHGRRTLCLPFLQWVHRFQRPLGVPYPVIWRDRLWNYLIGHAELGLPTIAMEAHFRELLGSKAVDAILEEFRQWRCDRVPQA